MNQKEEGEVYQAPADQKPNSRSLSNVYQDQYPCLDSTKRRRLFEEKSNVIETNLVKNDNEQATPTNFSLNTTYALNNETDPVTNRSESSTPTQSMSELHIKDSNMSRREIFMEQLRIRQAIISEKQPVRLNKRMATIDQTTTTSSSILDPNRKRDMLQYIRKPSPQQAITDNDDDIMIDEEMTNRNVCMGMIHTDIVIEKPPLLLIRDDQYEIVTLESEGRLNNDNYSFKVTSRSVPPKFFGWIPFKDTKVLGPLVDHHLIWWDAVIPRGKANHTRAPIYIILYCRPDLLGTIAKYLESQRVYLKTPPFYNPTCRFSNPHAHLTQPHHLHHHFHQQEQSYSYQQSSYNYNYQQRYYRPSDQQLQRQNQKDIEMLLTSIPSDVPVLNMRKKKKKQKLAFKRLRQGRPNVKQTSTVTEEGVIEILSEDEQDELDSTSPSSSSAEEEEDEGYVEGLTITLMDHQIKGVSWMIDRENNQSSNGGILADDMGLGKTIQTIALMASTMSMPELIQKNNNNDDEDQHQITLIITPLALIHQWVDEINSKTENDKFRVLKHHGPNRTKNPAVFREYDVIVTTYQVVASDVPSEPSKKKKSMVGDDFVVQEDDDEYDYLGINSTKREIPEKWQPLKKGYGPLFQMNWYRVVLDEAQQIKNRQTKAAISCSALSAKKRWCLTGTPIQNNVDELYSLLRFLKIQPLSDYPTFKKTISLPIQNGDSRLAMERLKAVLRAVMLRRTKDVLRGVDTSQQQQSSHESTPMESNASSPASNNNEKAALQLPSREKQDITLEFSDHERALYDLLKKKTQYMIQDMAGQSGYMNMLCLLLRLRQACDHPQLILKSIDNDKDVLDIVSDTSNNSSNPATPTDSSLSWSKSSCGTCSGYNDAAPFPFCKDCQSKPLLNYQQDLFKTSTKIRKMLEILEETRQNNPGEKTIIFSQFTSMLDLMEGPLRKHGFKICRYDGSMPTNLRERSLDLLKYDSRCTVMLISLKCGSLGLNLTAANRVILMDIWWNPALEEQAIDRVHRIGQKLPVHVTRLLIENTVEGNILQLQNKKAELTRGALGDSLVKSTKLTASEIRSLFDL